MRNSIDIINDILRLRGVISDEDINEFLSDKPKKTYDPFLLHDMKAGVDLLLSEIEKGNRICIYGDYDADGVTSVSIMLKGLSYLTDNLFYYIPSRFEEGYGLNSDAIDAIKERGANLIITVDCGCVSYKEVEHAKEIGLKVIVTDHHTINDVIADCIVINPKHPKSQYPYRQLAGCGVAFKLLQALQRTAGLPKSMLNEVLDLVAIGTVGDIVELRDENRTLVKYGLNLLNTRRSDAIKCLAEATSIGEIESENIAFGIVPRINAAGRIHHAADAVELFIAKNPADISAGVANLVEYNERRKKLQEDAYEKCKKMISGDETFIMLNVEGIHEGIAGIVAGKIKEYYNRSAVIVTKTGDGFLKGTGRSIDTIDLYDLLSKSADLFEKFGGHKGACGFLIKEENFEQLKSNTLFNVDKLIAENSAIFDKVLNFDMVLSPDDVNVDLVMALKKLEPFGEGNPAPVFCIKDAVIKQTSFMGDKQNHARFVIYANGEYADGVLFGKAQDYHDLLFNNSSVNVIGSLMHQVWRGRHQVKFRVEEIELCR
ncbi:MAG: single-stranded-DNA-specific exonuclease RecJ [Firmicutes bacterium]|nr:single-stranded-DNA-specific exonuclease RecJ [Bacillota bacterium]